MPRKILHRISRIFNPKEGITAIEPDPNVITSAHITPITLQRAPSSKLLIDDYMDISIDYNYNYYHEPKEQVEPIVIVESYKRSDPHRQSWMANLSKLKSLKKSSSNKKLKRSNDCWFNQRQVGEMIEIPDHHHEQQQGVSESPLSLASSLCSNQINPLSSSSSSSWLPIEEDNISTARTSLDSRLIKIDFSFIQEQPLPIATEQQKQISTSSKLNLAENVKQILGDAIFLADQELDI